MGDVLSVTLTIIINNTNGCQSKLLFMALCVWDEPFFSIYQGDLLFKLQNEHVFMKETKGTVKDTTAKNPQGNG